MVLRVLYIHDQYDGSLLHKVALNVPTMLMVHTSSSPLILIFHRPHHTVRSLARVFLATMELRSQSHTV